MATKNEVQEKINRLRTNTPPELQKLPQWVVWRYEPDPSNPLKDKKVPFKSANPSKRASHSDPATWSTFEKAVKAYTNLVNMPRGHYMLDGIGFVFSADDPYTGIDLDSLSPNDGRLHWLYECNSYAENSPSGEGIHIIVRGAIPDGKGHKNSESGVEIYDRTRFFTMTGDPVPGFEAINDNQPLVDKFLATYFLPHTPPVEVKQSPTPFHTNGTILLERTANKAMSTGGVCDDTDALWEKAFASKNGDRIRALYNGDTTGYPSQSEADQALYNHLAFWTRKNRDLMIAMFAETALYRPEKSERDPAIDKAIRDVKKTYAAPKQKLETLRAMVGQPDEDTSYLLTEGISDEGNAQATIKRYNGQFCLNDAFGWMQYVGTHWEREGAEAAVERAVVETLIARAQAGLQSGDLTRYKELIQKSIPNAGRVQGAKFNLSSLVVRSAGEFDRSPDLLNCANGVVDLRTGELYPHHQDQCFTYCTSTPYNPTATCDQWINWLTASVLGGAETVDWLQMAIGYSLTGHTTEEIMFYLYGPARSGKGTLTETLLALLGSPLSREIDFGTFVTQRDGDSQNFDLAPLKPCRLISASETNAYERFNEAKIKQVTGGNEVYCAFKHKTHFNYKPQFKIWLASNHPVNADPDDDSVWGRIRVIEFPTSHLGHEDKSLKYAMRSPESLEGILTWAIAGAMKWYALGRAGLPELSTGVVSKQQHRDNLDYVQAWFDEKCRRGETDFASSQAYYLSYEAWCKLNGVEPKKQKALTISLEHKGFTKTTKRDSKVQMRGLTGFKLNR